MNTLIANFAGNMTLWKNLFLDDPLPSDEHSSRVLLGINNSSKLHKYLVISN